MAAGDFLTYKFPTWSWATGDKSKRRDFLPEDKQYLVSRGVPCLRRVSQMESAAVGKRRFGRGKKGTETNEEAENYFVETGELGGKDDEWLGTDAARQAGGEGGSAEIMDIPDELDDSAPAQKLTSAEEDELARRVVGLGNGDNVQPSHNDDIGDIPDIPDIPDMDDALGAFGGELEEEKDDAAAPATSGPTLEGSDSAPKNSNLLSVRTYDCLITYDKYYQTPRMWLVGYDEHGSLLKPTQIFEDVSSDYAQKTVTIEPFPHSERMSTASIHPCKHASVMKKVLERMNASVVESQRQEAAASGQPISQAQAPQSGKKRTWGLNAVKKVAGKGDSADAKADTPLATSPSGADASETEGLRVDQYLIVFLKFMASIVPAIEIDATQAM